MENQKISPYEYVPGTALLEEHQGITGISADKLDRLFKDRIYQKVEYALLESLYRFPYLTKKCMERFADYQLKDKKYAGYDNVIKQLEKDGCLRRFVYDDTRIYRLNDGAREYFYNRLDPKGSHKIHVVPETNAAQVLESAALAQWHLSALFGGDVRKSYFGEEVVIRKKMLRIPSYLEIEKNAMRFRVLSYSVPKAELEMEGFLDNIIKLKEAMFRWELSLRRELFLVVLVCSSTHEMLQLAHILESLKATQKLQVYFVAESNTSFTKGLDLLYLAEREEDKLVLKTISVK